MASMLYTLVSDVFLTAPFSDSTSSCVLLKVSSIYFFFFVNKYFYLFKETHHHLDIFYGAFHNVKVFIKFMSKFVHVFMKLGETF